MPKSPPSSLIDPNLLSRAQKTDPQIALMIMTIRAADDIPMHLPGRPPEIRNTSEEVGNLVNADTACAIEKALAETPASSIDGALLKIEYAAWCAHNEMNDWHPGRSLQSGLAELLALLALLPPAAAQTAELLPDYDTIEAGWPIISRCAESDPDIAKLSDVLSHLAAASACDKILTDDGLTAILDSSQTLIEALSRTHANTLTAAHLRLHQMEMALQLSQKSKLVPTKLADAIASLTRSMGQAAAAEAVNQKAGERTILSINTAMARAKDISETLESIQADVHPLECLPAILADTRRLIDTMGVTTATEAPPAPEDTASAGPNHLDDSIVGEMLKALDACQTLSKSLAHDDTGLWERVAQLRDDVLIALCSTPAATVEEGQLKAEALTKFLVSRPHELTEEDLGPVMQALAKTTNTMMKPQHPSSQAA